MPRPNVIELPKCQIAMVSGFWGAIDCFIDD